MPETQMSADPRMIYFFGRDASEGDPARKDILGGKGASLSAMCRAGLPVPPGFTISIECCKAYHANDGRWPDGLEDGLQAYMKRLEEATGKRYGEGADPLLVSVRSGAAQSMPGMMDTILNCGLHAGLADQVPDAEKFWSVYAAFVKQFGNTADEIPLELFEEAAKGVAGRTSEKALAEAYIGVCEREGKRPFPTTAWDALRSCIDVVFESWDNDRARVYRKAHGLEHLGGTAVNVQSMFNSRVSGIAFTANPSNPSANEIIIESAYGLGESIVSGDVTPDRWVLDRETLAVKEETVGRKEHVMTGLVHGEEAAAQDPDAVSLTPEQVEEVGRLALAVEDYFGFPVDIEWGLARGKFSLLQSRAVRGLDVALDVQKGRLEEIERLKSKLDGKAKAWIIHNLAETLSAPTPLTWEIMRDFMSGDGGFGQMYKDFGYRPGERVCKEGFLELICGRIYADPDRCAELFWEGMPSKYDHQEVLENPQILESAPMKFDAARADGTFLLRLPGTVLAMLRSSRIMKRARRNAREDFEEVALPPYCAYIEETRCVDLSEMSTEEVIRELHERIRHVLTDFGKESLKPGFFGGLARAELETALVQLLGEIDGANLCQVLTSGLEGDTTAEQYTMLYHVGQGKESMETFIEAYGHRAVDEMELSKPRFREDQAYLEKTIARQSGSEENSPEALHRRNRERREQALAGLPEVLKEWGGSSQREDIEDLVREAQALLPYREIGKHYLIMGYELIRAAIIELGRRWEIGDGVFFLHLDELPRFEAERDQLKEKAAARKVRWQSAQRLDMPDIIDSAELDDLGLPRQLEGAAEMDALSLAAGVATGTARIVFHPEEAGDVGDDCILVCPSTDPSWTALFTQIKGLVVERGGVLSHGAITARDFSIPAVACPDATAIIKEGGRVRVDGDRGHISIIED